MLKTKQLSYPNRSKFLLLGLFLLLIVLLISFLSSGNEKTTALNFINKEGAVSSAYLSQWPEGLSLTKDLMTSLRAEQFSKYQEISGAEYFTRASVIEGFDENIPWLSLSEALFNLPAVSEPHAGFIIANPLLLVYPQPQSLLTSKVWKSDLTESQILHIISQYKSLFRPSSIQINPGSAELSVDIRLSAFLQSVEYDLKTPVKFSDVLFTPDLFNAFDFGYAFFDIAAESSNIKLLSDNKLAPVGSLILADKTESCSSKDQICNNITDIFPFTNFHVSELPAVLVVRLWKNIPENDNGVVPVDQKPDLLFKINFS